LTRREQRFPESEHPALQNRIDGTAVLTVTIVYCIYNKDLSHLSITVVFAMPSDYSENSDEPVYNTHNRLGEFRIRSKATSLRETMSLDTNTDIKSCGGQISKWMTACIESHSACERFRQTDWYPTRLLDLGDPNAAKSNGMIKLIETRNERLTGPYATLSHCWGGATLVKLERGVLPRFKDGIKIELLPKTFVDAIAVANYLRIRYLWVDSLTIIQDDADDWATESAAMEHIYQNSFCNIGATASANSHGGLFFERRPELVLPHLLVLGSEPFEIEWLEDWHYVVNNQALLQRAWVVQERWLCPRMLHFCQDQIYWECKTGTASEGSPVLGGMELSLKKFGRPTESSTVAETAATWRWLVYFYSRANLTFAKHKLVAFSGIAKAMQHVLKDRYVAGLWETNFIRHLAWSIEWEGCVPEPRRPKEYVAPSWSWASVNGAVRLLDGWHEQPSYQEVTSVSSIHLEHTGQDLFGQVKAGYVRLVGPLMEVECNWQHQALFYRGDELSAHATFDVWPEDDRDGEKFVCLGLCLTPWASSPNSHYGAIGLLLKQISGLVGVFVRVGLCEIYESSRHPGYRFPQTDKRIQLDRNSTQFISALAQPTKISSLPDELFDFDPNRGYTITII